MSDNPVKAAHDFLDGTRETYATVLLGIVLKTYGAEALDWHLSTLEAQITEDFKVKIPSLVYDQLMGIVTVLTTQYVYTSVSTFEHVVNALCRVGVGYAEEPPTPDELGWAVFEMAANDPDSFKGKSPFSPSVAAYIGVVLKDAGFSRLPKILNFANMQQSIPGGLNTDPGLFNAAFDSSSDLAQGVDEFVESQLEKLIEHLMGVGIDPAPLESQEASENSEEEPLNRLLGD